jgi:hypothetical protein
MRADAMNKVEKLWWLGPVGFLSTTESINEAFE